MSELLFEIGSEELPGRFVDPALAFLNSEIEKELKNQRVSFTEIVTEGTPRRLVVMVTGLSDKQPDLVTQVLGPKADLAWTPQGDLSQIGQGFLKSRGLQPEDAYKKKTEKGEVIAAQLTQMGQRTVDVLPSILQEILKKIPFQRTMRWEESGALFARPVRWLLAIYDGKTLPIEFAGVQASNQSCGHRFLSPEFVPVAGIDAYLKHLKNSFVMLKRDERRRLIAEQATKIATHLGGFWREDSVLLDLVKNLVEYPWVVAGEFEKQFLDIPHAILLSEMREHQKYFSIIDQHGALLPFFIVAVATRPIDEKEIAAGNARVLRARFEDGAFYFKEDCQVSLSDRLNKLSSVLFQRELGTLKDKTDRIVALTAHFAEQLKIADAQNALRAALLSKTDLVSGVVQEFPELQGAMGHVYAARAGEKALVAQAIEEHYLPKFAGDQLPTTTEGALVGLADRLDTIAGVIGIGKAPTGSADPFALRRAAIGMVRILIGRGYRLSLRHAITQAAGLLNDRAKLKSSEIERQAMEFIGARARGAFIEDLQNAGITRASVLVDGALEAGFDDVTDLWARVQALSKLQLENHETFNQLLATLKRAGNIITKAKTDGLFDPKTKWHKEALKEKAELDLLAQIEQEAQPSSLNSQVNLSKEQLVDYYLNVMTRVAQSKPYLDRFFDEVMVMVDDVKLRTARLGLLNQFVVTAFEVADFTRVQIDAP